MEPNRWAAFTVWELASFLLDDEDGTWDIDGCDPEGRFKEDILDGLAQEIGAELDRREKEAADARP